MLRKTLFISILSILFSSSSLFSQQTVDVKSGNDKYKSGDYTGAITEYNKALIANPNNIDALIKRASTYQQAGDYTNAVTDYNKAISLNGKIAFYYMNRGYCKYMLTDKKGAETDYNKSIEIEPNGDAQAYKLRGALKKENGDKEGACADFNKLKTMGDADADKLLAENKCK